MGPKEGRPARQEAVTAHETTRRDGRRVTASRPCREKDVRVERVTADRACVCAERRAPWA